MATSIPPHNVAELVDAAVHLIDKPEADSAELMQFVRGPDFPTGGVLVDGAQSIADAYASGRGAFRVRALIEKVDEKGGGWHLVVSQIPYQVPKSKLIEAIAELINEKKLPILADVRDESDEDIRIILEPRSRTVDADMLMESLYRLTDLEVRVSLNLNVLDDTRTPMVMSLAQALSAWLKHQFEVLVRRSQHRLAKIADRIELLDGYLIVYLNLDRIIQIIREEDEPKPVMIAEFGLTDRQAEAILNMRLRSLRKLEEMEIRKERDTLDAEGKDLEALIASPARQRTRMKRDLAALRTRYGPETALGARRTTLSEAAPAREIPLEAMVEREPVTVILSQRGWIRAMKGHLDDAATTAVKFKEGDGPAFAIKAQTTDRILLATDQGRFYTLPADKLPGGRGFGEPVRLFADVEADARVVALLVARPGAELLLASADGKGFVVDMAEVTAETRKGKQIVNLRDKGRLAVIHPVAPGDDYIAAIGDNRKMVVFPLSELPRMSRGQGVTIQRYKDGGLSDAISFRLDDGLSWTMGGETGRTRSETDLTPWRAARGAAGRMPPVGFPRDNRFRG